MTHSAIRQIERARHATFLLRQGASISRVAYDLGYCDQAHLVRSLRRFIGQTPSQVIRGDRQLSLLYNTADAQEVNDMRALCPARARSFTWR